MHTVIFVGFAKMFILELDINHFERELSVLDLDSVESIDVVEGVLVHLNHILHLIPMKRNNMNPIAPMTFCSLVINT